jgi:hypothetical protein
MRKSSGIFLAGLALGVAVGAALNGWRPARLTGETTATRPAARAQAQASAAGNAPAQTRTDTGAASTLQDEIGLLRRWTDGDDAQLTRKQAVEIVRRWAGVDPLAARDFVATAKRFPGRSLALAAPLAALAKRDVRGVIAWLQKYATEEERGDVAERVIELMVQDDPAAAFELAEAEHTPVDTRYFSTILETMVKRDPATALRNFGRLSESGRQLVAQGFARAWYAGDPAGALAWLGTQTAATFHREAALGMLQAAMQRDEPAALRSAVAQLKPTSVEIQRVLMMRGDSISAENQLTLLQSLDGKARTEAVSMFVRENLEGSPDTMLELVRTLLPREARSEALELGLDGWLRSDRAGVLNWLATVKDAELAQTLRSTVAARDARGDPETFLKAAELRPATGDDKRQLVEALMSWTEHSPADAAAWISRNPARVDPGSAAMVASEYIGRDPAAGAAWVEGLPKGPLQDTALQAAAERWCDRGDLANATRAVNGISEDSRRLAAMYAVFSSLTRKDGATALKWAEEQGLSEETRLTWIAIARERAAFFR